MTRANVNAATPAVPGTPGTPATPAVPGNLEGDAGSVEEYELVSGINNEKVGEDEEDQEVIGVNITADEGSDLEFTAVKLVFDEGTAASDFDEYAAEVAIFLDGEEVARVDADGFTDDNSWTRTLSLDSGAIVRAGETGELTVAVSGISNLDTNDATDTWTVDIRQVRFRDGAGDSTSEDPTLATRTFSFESFATAANSELKIRANDDLINNDRVIDVHATNDTDNVALASFTLEAEGDSDLEIKKFHASTTVTSASNVDDLINSITLWIDGEEIATGEAVQDTDGVSVGADEGWLFDDISYTIAAGEKVEAEIRADFNSVADALDEGDTITVAITEAETDQASLFKVADESGENLLDADITGSVTGGAHTVRDAGISVELVGTPTAVKSFEADAAGEVDQGTYTIAFDVTAFGSDVYVDLDTVATATPNAGTDGSSWATTTESTATSTTVIAQSIAPSTSDSTNDTAYGYFVEEDSTRRFTVSVVLKPTDDSLAGVRLSGVKWGTVSTSDNTAATSADQNYTFNLDAFKTGLLNLSVI
ncbi:MAG: hypothetical protein A2589_03370 [Candidatus Vogelbacteria bacterium RIFOXYD1_FULL_46_19]|uniref:Uncharacterized protein n=1 Tax=Candidatus Vogelbacteria bacterium RIFOXYD1_FULL_46_19 TaxID=1802439 RepID=A0A1G2QFP9_9BACT|nr:MAG: hypothetical protein A2589_03370 [Candidatus Vogelbacteria bacterium RIFOXYD1_FULL_46_19]